MIHRNILFPSRWLTTSTLLVAVAVWSACSDAPRSAVEPDLEASGQVFEGLQGSGAGPAFEVQARHGDRLMSIPGVTGHGVGIDSQGQPVLLVFTVRPGVEGVPARVDGVPTRTVESGMFVALTDETVKHRPAPLGVSIGHPDITAGTLGFKVKTGAGEPHVLSNNHVLANGNDASVGDNILQPGPYDGGADPADRIGELAAFIPIDFSGGDNLVDAAIASVGSADVLSHTPAEEGYGQPSATTRAATPGMAVQKYGRTTGHTFGAVDAVNVTVDVCYEARGPFRCVKLARFVGQIVITPGSFSAGGDSGSGIVTDDADLDPVGLLFAGSSTHTIANPIDAVLDALGVTIDDGSGGGEEEGGDPENDAPTANDVAASGDEDAPIAWTPDVSDPNAGDALVCSIVEQPTNGSATVASDCSGGTYTPDADFNGGDSFTYSVSDGTASDPGTVSVTVAPVNDAPVASDDAYSVTAGTTLVVPAPGVLGNDSDVDGDALTAVLDSDVDNGALVLDSDGSFSYTPDASTTNDSFTYHASDGSQPSNLATVLITVTEAAWSMHVGDLSFTSINQGSAWDAEVTVTVVDTNGQPVEGATVTGSWTGEGSGSGACGSTTDANGQCTVMRTGIHKRTGSVTYTVGAVSHSDLAYDGSANVETSIDVSKP